MGEIIFSEDCDRNMNNEIAWEIKSKLESRIKGNRIIGWVPTDGYCFFHTLVRLLQSNQVKCVINSMPELATFLSGVVASGLLFTGESPNYKFNPREPFCENIIQAVVMLLNIKINIWDINDDFHLKKHPFNPIACSTHLHEDSLCSFKDNFVEMFKIQIPRGIEYELDLLLYGGHFYPLENNKSSLANCPKMAGSNNLLIPESKSRDEIQMARDNARQMNKSRESHEYREYRESREEIQKARVYSRQMDKAREIQKARDNSRQMDKTCEAFELQELQIALSESLQMARDKDKSKDSQMTLAYQMERALLIFFLLFLLITIIYKLLVSL